MILENVADCARARPIVIQSCFFRLNGEPPPEAEVTEYLARLREISARGGRISLVQVHTVARPPAYGAVSSLAAMEVEAIAARIRAETGLPAAAFYGEVPPGRGVMGRTPPKAIRAR
jgi:hypothetical protein